MSISEIMRIQPDHASGAIGSWKDCVSRNMLRGLDVDSENGDIVAELLAFDFAGARLWFLGSNAQRAVRSEPVQRRSAPVAIFLLEGVGKLSQDGRECELEPGSFAFVDAARPLKLEHPGTFRELYLQFPQKAFRAGDFQKSVAVKMSARTSLDRPLYDCVRNVWDAAGDLKPEDHSAAISALISLASMTSAFRHGKAQASLPMRVERAMGFIEHRLGDERLSAQAVADSQGVSRRYLDELFLQSGHRIESWIWERRLQRAADELRVQRQNNRSLLQIALDLGFKDPSHFSRMFTRRHGVSPRQYRRDHTTETAGAIRH